MPRITQCLTASFPFTASAATTSTLKILHFNCNGLRNKKDDLEHHQNTHSIHIAAIQETKLTARAKDPKLLNYAIYRKDQTAKQGGGLLMLIHNSIPFTITKLPDDNTIESQAIMIKALYST
jgi:exonuclease III